MSDIKTTPLRNALTWATDTPQKGPSDNPFVWFWEAIEGDFNEERSTSQLLVDAGISMIPLVDQVCDIRDLIANVRKLTRNVGDTWAWISLALTLIGLFPVLGSLVKGVLKIFFGYIRRAGGEASIKAIDAAMTLVITFLRRRDVQKYLKLHKVDEVFQWLAKEIKAVRAKINVAELMKAFDRIIKVIQGMVDEVKFIPYIGKKAVATLEEIKHIRLKADGALAKAIKPLQDYIDQIALRLEKEMFIKQKGIVDVKNVHFRGAIPEAAAVGLMRTRKPKWLTEKTANAKFFDSVPLGYYRNKVDKASAKIDSAGKRRPHKDIFPSLTDSNIKSFHTLAPHVIVGPARLYRILAPNSKGTSDCWVTEAVFKKLNSAADPKAAWRKYLAVWPDWNVNGQFVIYDVKAGESLNVWRGIASSQEKSSLKGFHLEGGYEQIIFKLEQLDVRNDNVLWYKAKGGNNMPLNSPLTQKELDVLKQGWNSKQTANFYATHLMVRESIRHDHISGPFSTGWDVTEFDGSGFGGKVGLPSLPGQITNVTNKTQ
jgi:hypothetical protein